jgi:hypothetical protein
MPNTFLDSYFKGRQENLERDQMLQQEQARQAQLAFSQQQLAQQAQQFQVQQGFEAAQAAQRNKQYEEEVKRNTATQLWQQQLQIGQAVGAGQLKPVDSSPFLDSLGLPPPPAAPGQFSLNGKNFAPTTLEDRATQARGIAAENEKFEQAQKISALQEGFRIAKASGMQLDPEIEGALTIANIMPNFNAVGLLNKMPKKFEEMGVQAMDTWGSQLVDQMMKNPGAMADPKFQQSLQSFQRFRDLFKPPSASSIPGGNTLVDHADQQNRYRATSLKMADLLRNFTVTGNDADKSQQLEALKFKAMQQIDGRDFSKEAVDEAITNWLKQNPFLGLRDKISVTPAAR